MSVHWRYFRKTTSEPKYNVFSVQKFIAQLTKWVCFIMKRA